MKLNDKPRTHFDDVPGGPNANICDRMDVNRTWTEYQVDHGVFVMCHCDADGSRCSCKLTEPNDNHCDFTCNGRTFSKRNAYSFTMFAGDDEANLNLLDMICHWSVDHRRKVNEILYHTNGELKRSLVVCPHTRYLMMAFQVMQTCISVSFVLGPNGQFMDQSGDPLRSENAVIGWWNTMMGLKENVTKEPMFDFYSGCTSNASLARNDCGPAIIFNKYISKSNFDSLVHLKNASEDGRLDNDGQVRTVLLDYLPRFIAGALYCPFIDAGMNEFLLKLRSTSLMNPSKNPIGLNPERLSKSCINCRESSGMIFRMYAEDLCWDCEG